MAFTVGGRAFRLPLSGLMSEANLAATAKISVSGIEQGYGFSGATDGVLGGYPAQRSAEWSSGKVVGATLRLAWDAPVTLDRIALFDRPNLTDQVTAGLLTWSDGSTQEVGALPNDGLTPLELRFAPKTVRWVEFKISAAKPGTASNGLSEIAAYRAP